MLLSSAILAIGVLPFVSFVKAFPSFAGTNLYYAAGLSASQRATYFAGLQSADMKVLRVWLDGQSTATTKNTPITSYPDLETTVGVYNDTVLDLLDAVMLDAKNYGIKLLISMHSWNALSRPDIYGETYGVENFYIWQNATEAFDNRMRHVMNHVHSTLHVPWKHLSDYIFAFEAENEMAIGNGQDFIVAHSDWQCGRAQVIKAELAGAQILVTTGGESWLDESINDTLLNCTHLDVVAVHAYGVGDLNTTKIQPYVTSALQNGKKLLFQEWGACYYNTSNNVCSNDAALPESQRDTNILEFAGNISAAEIPWLYWQVLPNADPHYGYDYEVGLTDLSFQALATAAKAASNYDTPFDFTPYLL